MNDLTNVALHHAAVGEHAGETSRQPADPTAGSSFGSAVLTTRSDALPSPDEPRVSTTTIDDLNLTRCDLIKIDAEGMERAVLEGSRRLIRQFRPWVSIECQSVESGLKSCRFLQTHGYDVRLHLGRAFNPDQFRQEPANIFHRARKAALVGIPPNFGGKSAVSFR